MKNLVVIGGGTGAFTVLRGIKNIPGVKITAIVSSADSGGSSGLLRDEFGHLPVGDFRQCLVALAKEDSKDENILRELFQYRFDKGGKGLEGHAFGNLFLTALTDILGDEELAFQKASKILNVKGRVLPVTIDDIQLVAEYADGTIGFGEAMIDDPPKAHDGKQRIIKLWTQPSGTLLAKSKEKIESADFIILGPGDLYTSILANFVIDDVCKVVKQSKAKIIYFPNLVTKYGQTYGFSTSDFVDEIEKYIGRPASHIIINNTPLPKEALDRYIPENAYKVEDDLSIDKRVIRTDLVSDIFIERKKADLFKRSLVRHDSEKVARVIEGIVGK